MHGNGGNNGGNGRNMRPNKLRGRRSQPNKLLGQHFLISSEVREKIIAAAELSSSDTVLEIGPGTGALTYELARRARAVVAVEKDAVLAAALEKKLTHSGVRNVRVICGDILKMLPAALPLPKNYKVVANIPYYLTSRLIRVLLEGPRPPKEMLLMVQREVAERIIARPPRMNLLALSVQAYGAPRILFPVSRSAFSPRPAVDSAVIHLKNIPREFFAHNKINPELFFRLIRAGFHTRRKTLANTLTSLFESKKMAVALLEGTGIDPGARAERLSLEEWATLTRAAAGR